jgi:DNA-binding CsgD family transcriptional regulator
VLELPASASLIATEVARIASTPGRISHRAQALLEPLHDVVPFEGAWISLLDPEAREQPPLVCQGFPEGAAEYVSSPEGVAETENVGLNHSRAAMRLCDLPVPVNELPSWEVYLSPAGFRGGLAAGLFTTDGRYLGVLSLATDTPTHPTVAARNLITELTTTIADGLDPIGTLSTAVRIIRDADAGIVLTRTGNVLHLPGLPAHPLLSPGSPVLSAVTEQLTDGTMHATFLAPRHGGHVRITALGCPIDTPQYLRAIVVLSAAGDLRGLTGSELELIGLLIDDWPNQRIATTLNLPVPTIVERIQRVRAKLRAPTRTMIAVRALRAGLYVPRSLSQAAHQ